MPLAQRFYGYGGESPLFIEFLNYVACEAGDSIVAHLERLTVVMAPYSLISDSPPYRRVISVSSVTSNSAIRLFRISKPRKS